MMRRQKQMTYLLPSSSQTWEWTIFYQFLIYSCISISFTFIISINASINFYSCNGYVQLPWQ